MIKGQIIDGIKAYADAYGKSQRLQEENRHFLAVGDQKTGAIGEFFGLLYARSKYSSANVEYAKDPTQTGWDIEVPENESGPDLKIQVDSISVFKNPSHHTTIPRLGPPLSHIPWQRLHASGLLDRQGERQYLSGPEQHHGFENAKSRQYTIGLPDNPMG